MGKKAKGKKKGGKGKKKGKKKAAKKEVEVPKEPQIKVPDGHDWIVMSFCLVPWEHSITMFLNFETLLRTNMTIKSLQRVVEGKIGSVSRLTFYLNPPKKEEPLNLEECENFRLIDLDFKGGLYDNPERCILFFDFDPSYPTTLFTNTFQDDQMDMDHIVDIGIDPILLAEPSQILMNHSEKVKQEASELFKKILNRPSKKKKPPKVEAEEKEEQQQVDDEHDDDSQDEEHDDEDDAENSEHEEDQDVDDEDADQEDQEDHAEEEEDNMSEDNEDAT